MLAPDPCKRDLSCLISAAFIDVGVHLRENVERIADVWLIACLVSHMSSIDFVVWAKPSSQVQPCNISIYIEGHIRKLSKSTKVMKQSYPSISSRPKHAPWNGRALEPGHSDILSSQQRGVSLLVSPPIKP